MSLNEKYDNYTGAYNPLYEVLAKIISSGELTQEDKDSIEAMSPRKDEALLDLKGEIDKVRRAYADGKLDYLTDRLGKIESKILKEDDRIQLSVSMASENLTKLSQLTIDIEGITGRVEQVERNVNIIDVQFEYYLSTSNKSLVGGEWLDYLPSPESQDGKFLWTKTVTYYSNDTTKEDGLICVSAQKGADGIGVEEIVIEYAKSTSTTSAPTSGWGTSIPDYVEGYYLWQRTGIKYTNSDNYEYSTPICDQTWRAISSIYSQFKQTTEGFETLVAQAQSTAEDAQDTANSASWEAASAYSKATQSLNKFEWIVSGGTSSSNMVLTDNFLRIVSENVTIDATTIELRGSININYGSFKVSTSGNTQIGGSSAVYADGYWRSQCEITSNGTIYSCSSSRSNEYTKITEGRVSTYTGGYFTAIGANGIKSNDELVLACDNMSLDYTGSSPGRIRFRQSSGNYYFDPHISGQTRNGSATNPWHTVYSQNGTSTGSDRNLKENIKYLDYDELNEFADKTNDITTRDCLDFLTKDYLLATYNYIGDNKEKLSAVAQDVIYNVDGTVNKVGNLVVDCEESVENGSLLNMNQTQLLNVVIGGMQGMYKELKQELEEIRNGS